MNNKRRRGNGTTPERKEPSQPTGLECEESFEEICREIETNRRVWEDLINFSLYSVVLTDEEKRLKAWRSTIKPIYHATISPAPSKSEVIARRRRRMQFLKEKRSRQQKKKQQQSKPPVKQKPVKLFMKPLVQELNNKKKVHEGVA